MTDGLPGDLFAVFDLDKRNRPAVVGLSRTGSAPDLRSRSTVESTKRAEEIAVDTLSNLKQVGSVRELALLEKSLTELGVEIPDNIPATASNA